MFPFFNRHASSDATSAQPAAVNPLAMQSIPADTPQENDASDEERPATYEELMPYLMLAMVAAR